MEEGVEEEDPKVPPVDINPSTPNPPLPLLLPKLPISLPALEGIVDVDEPSLPPLVLPEEFLSIADFSSKITLQDRKFNAVEDTRNSPIFEKYSLLSILPCLNN